MDNKLRIMIDKIKEDFAAQGTMMRKLNKIVPIKGERHIINLPDRDIDMAYYRAESEGAPLIIGLHGGGFVFGGSALDDDMWLAVSEALDVNVASLDYRKCPDYRWPAPVEDVFECACYLKEHAEEFGFDPADMSVMGFSAGANLAATACIYAKRQGKDLYKRQYLMYPCIDLATDPADKGEEGSFEPAVLMAFNEMYIDAENAKNILASPVFATQEELAGLPEAIVVLAEKDELKHEGGKYVQMLNDADVPVSYTTIEDMPHAYFENGYLKSTEGRDLDPWTLECLENGTMKAACEMTLQFIKDCVK
ncbi:MAG: alpha/beta hydrolase [Eubacterium sp.]|nr:alpha/beta hydrolase [Eubacterium sp.]